MRMSCLIILTIDAVKDVDYPKILNSSIYADRMSAVAKQPIHPSIHSPHPRSAAGIASAKNRPFLPKWGSHGQIFHGARPAPHSSSK